MTLRVLLVRNVDRGAVRRRARALSVCPACVSRWARGLEAVTSRGAVLVI